MLEASLFQLRGRKHSGTPGFAVFTALQPVKRYAQGVDEAFERSLLCIAILATVAGAHVQQLSLRLVEALRGNHVLTNQLRRFIDEQQRAAMFRTVRLAPCGEGRHVGQMLGQAGMKQDQNGSLAQTCHGVQKGAVSRLRQA